MQKRIWLGVFVAMLVVAPVSGCRSRGKAASVDTTKEIYSDDEVPKEQIVVVNGIPTAVPWERVPEKDRWLMRMEEDGRYRYRVPIARIEVTSVDREGRPVPMEQGYEVNGLRYGLNPEHWSHVYYGHAH